MIGKRPQADRILVAGISGEAEHHAKWRELTADEQAAAVAALRGLAGGRAGLRAEVCGVMGASEGEPRGCRRSPAARTAAECRAAPVLREVHRERGMRVCFFVEEPAGRDLPGAGNLIARREITGAGQQRLDRYRQRRDEYLRQLAHLAPPLPGEQKARLAVLLPPRSRSTGAGRRLDVWASGRRLGRRPERNYVPGMAQTCVTGSGSGKIRMAGGAGDDLARAQVLNESRDELRARAERAEQGWSAALAELPRTRREAEPAAAPSTPKRRHGGQSPAGE